MKKDSAKKDPATALKVKRILEAIKKAAPGSSLELRIPLYGTIQCVAGSNHRRGTPPNTVEMSGQTLIKLINEPSLWITLCESGEVRASGLLSDLSNLFAQAAVKYRA
jgi:Bacterial SCP ortholog